MGMTSQRTQVNERRVLRAWGVRHVAAIAWLAACLAGGCGPTNDDIQKFVHDWETTVSATEYRVIPPDSIKIASPTAPEIDGELQQVRQDGKITLRLLGEVKVAGLTPVEIGHKLKGLLARYYVDPQVSVRVAGGGTKKYYVFGQVGRSGAFRYTGRDTVLSALAEAQPTFLAWKSQIKVLHPSHESGRRHIITVDAEGMMERGDLGRNVHLQEGDIVFVPPTPLAWVGLRVRELLFPVQPILQTAVGPAVAYDTFDDGFADDD